MNKYAVPRLAFVNKMDRPARTPALRRADQDRLRGNPVPLQLPIGAEDKFEGVVTHPHEGIYWDDATEGMKFEYREVPAEMLEQCNEWREKLGRGRGRGQRRPHAQVLETGELTIEEIRPACGERSIRTEICIMLCGSAFKNKGVQAMLDAVIDTCRRPRKSRAVKASTTGAAKQRARRRTTPSSRLAFKILNDPFVGNLTFFRVYSGVLNSGDQVYVPAKSKKERIGRLLQMHAADREEIKEVAPATSPRRGPQGRDDGRHAVRPEHIITLEKMEFRSRHLGRGRAKTKSDQEKMGLALQRLAKEDPSFRVSTDQESGQTIISGMGELHLDIIVDRMKREFKVEANVGKPQVAYAKPSAPRSSRKASSSASRAAAASTAMCGSNRAAGRRQGLRVRQRHRWRRGPREYIPASTRASRKRSRRRDRRLPSSTSRSRSSDGSYHDVDSNEMRSRSRARWRSRTACARRAVLLEPIMKVEVVTPEDYSGDVIGDLNRRRGQIQGMEDSVSGKVVTAEVPLAEMFGYATSSAR